MRGYESYKRPRHDRRVEEYDDYGYEDDGCGYEEDGDEYEEEEDEVEDAPRPTKEALEFLELRQRLKEQIRKEMKKKEGGQGNTNDRKKLPYDRSFGSFFGPSQPVIAERVIQESKSLLEHQHLVSRAAKLVNHSKKNSGSTPSGAKPVERTQKPSTVNEQNNIVQKRKDTRDYTFLFSEDAELPAPAKNHHPQHDSTPMSDMRSNQSVMKSKPYLVNGSRPPYGSHDNGRPVQGIRENGRPAQGRRDSGRPVPGSRDGERHVQGSRDSERPVHGSRESGRSVQVSRESGRPVLGSRESGRSVQVSRESGRHVTSGHDERKLVPSNGHIHSKVGSHRPSSASGRPGSTSMDSRKQLGSYNAAGPGRPLRPKGLPSKIPASTSERRVSASGLKNTMSSLQKLPSSQSQSSHLKQPVQQRKDTHGPYKPSMLSKQSTVLSKNQIHKPQMHKEIPSHPMAQEPRFRKRPTNGFADDEYDPENGDISSYIRGMFRYDPNKFADDDDDSNMEAGWEDIMREERRSALIAKREDEEQARLIEEDERRDRMRKQKKLKR